MRKVNLIYRLCKTSPCILSNIFSLGHFTFGKTYHSRHRQGLGKGNENVQRHDGDYL